MLMVIRWYVGSRPHSQVYSNLNHRITIHTIHSSSVIGYRRPTTIIFNIDREFSIRDHHKDSFASRFLNNNDSREPVNGWWKFQRKNYKLEFLYLSEEDQKEEDVPQGDVSKPSSKQAVDFTTD